MKKSQRILLMFIILIILVIIGIISILFADSKKSEDLDEILKKEQERYLYGVKNPAQIINGKTPVKVKVPSIYYTVDSYVKDYLSALKNNNEEMIYSYLNEDLIKSESINVENILKKVEKYQNYNEYRTFEMYGLSGGGYASYYIKGKIDEKEIYFQVNLDNNNNTFDLKPITEKIYSTEIVKKAYTKESNVKTIKENSYNKHIFINLSDEKICKMYLLDYIKLMFIYPNDAYKMLEEENRNSNFKNIEDFKNYIKDNQEKLKLIYDVQNANKEQFNDINEYSEFLQKNNKYIVKNCNSNKLNESTQYECMDYNGNKYIFIVKEPSEYTVILK